MTAAASRTDPARARKLAEQCFAVARSTKFDGEREAAIAKGTAIAERANLPLDQFDIPGRSKPNTQTGSNQSRPKGTSGAKRPSRPSRPSSGDTDEMLRRAKATRASWESDEWYAGARNAAQRQAEERLRQARESKQAFDDLAEALRRHAETFDVRPGETPYDARRRAFAEATETPASELFRRADLRGRWPSTDAVINALRARRVHVAPVDSRVSSNGEVLPLWIVTAPSVIVLDQWSLRELADEVVK